MHVLQFKSGFTTCPACSIKGVPQEPYMAVPTVDDRVFCYACNLVSSSIDTKGAITRDKLFPALQALPSSVLDIVMSLFTSKVGDGGVVSPTYHFVSIGEKGFGFSDPMTEDDMTRAAGAVACGNAHYIIDEADRMIITLAHGPYRFHTLRLSYKPSGVAAAERVSGDKSAQFAALLDRVSGVEASAIRGLMQQGFQPGGFNLDLGIKHVNLFKGSASEGISAEISWIP